MSCSCRCSIEGLEKLFSLEFPGFMPPLPPLELGDCIGEEDDSGRGDCAAITACTTSESLPYRMAATFRRAWAGVAPGTGSRSIRSRIRAALAGEDGGITGLAPVSRGD